MMFVGAMTALVTPLRGGRVDEPALARLVEAQIAAGIDGLVPCGTTGEAPTLEPAEQARVIGVVVETARRRVPVVAGCGSSSTAHAVALGKAAKQAGADGLLAVTPYYNRPTQEGLVGHFASVAEGVGLPVIVYNVPGRTGVDFAPEALGRLLEMESRIVGVKEASGSAARTQELHRRFGPRIAILSGDDALNLAIYAVGGRGCISVTSNVVPKLVADAWDAAREGDWRSARALHEQTLGLSEALFLESNPIPVKAALAMLGAIGPEIRPPLGPLGEAAQARLRAALAQHGFGT